MIRFSLGSIPVEVRPSHFLVALLLSLRYGQEGAAIVTQHRPGTDPNVQWLFVGGWVLVIAVSVLVHELGHALAAKAFGFSPHITLIAFGGVTHTEAPQGMPWTKEAVLTLAGPLFGLLLAIACAGAWLLIPAPPGAPPSPELATLLGRTALRRAAELNTFWSVFNLLPLIPLDGGKLAYLIATRLFGGRGVLVAHVLSLATLVGVLLLLSPGPIGLVLLALFGWQSMAAIWSYFRGAPADPLLETTLQRAKDALDAGDTVLVARLLAPLAEQAQPAIRSRAHHLLGWAALKEARGRQALDHFAQAQEQEVEPEALAAAFSLVGDDARALSLWESAHRARPDATVLHELGGTLLRLGRVEDARRLPGLDLRTAFRFGARVLFLRERFDDAARLGEQGLALAPDAEAAYDVACARARMGDNEGALSALERARTLGFKDAELARSDPDLAALASHPRFVAWAASLR